MSQSTDRPGGEPDDNNVMPFRDVNADTMPRRIGEQLLSGRLAMGVEIGDISSQLHIRQDYLQALEDGRFDDIPGATYVAGFLRTYANHLGLDGEEMVRMYKDESGGALVRQDLYFPIPASEARRPTGTMIIGALLIAVIALALWYVIQERELVDFDLVPPVPEFLDESSTEDRAVLATQDVEETSANATDVENLFNSEADDDVDPQDEVVVPAQTVREEPAVVAAVVTDAEGVAESLTDGGQEIVGPTEPSDVVDEVPLPDPPPDSGSDVAIGADVAALSDTDTSQDIAPVDEDYVPRVYGRTNADSRVEIRAIDTSWVQIEAPGNQVLLTRVLLPGDVYRVPNGDQITLKTGNAGGLELRVDGALIEPLGEPGVVIKDVSLDPNALLEQ